VVVTRLETLMAEALELPERDRAAFAARLLRSLEPDDEPVTVEEWEAAWGEEIERRVQQIRSGNVELVDGDEVLKAARARLTARRA
jgi:hypothetical protein